MTIYEALCELAPTVGAEFRSRDIMYKVDGMTLKDLFHGLQALKEEGKVRFTGTNGIFKRLA